MDTPAPPDREPPIQGGPPAVPPAPSLPVAPPADAAPPSPRRGPVVLAAIVVGVVAAVVVFSLLGGDEATPSTALGMPRVESEELDAMAEMLDEMEFGGMDISVQAFGEGGQPQVIVYRYDGLPATFSVEGMVRGAAGGVIGAGGSADVDAISSHPIGGVTYHCVPVGGQMLPSDTVAVQGVACGWALDDDSAVMWLDTTTTSAPEAAARAAAFAGDLG